MLALCGSLKIENTQNFQDELQVDQAFSRLQHNVVMCYHIAKPTCLKENAMLLPLTSPHAHECHGLSSQIKSKWLGDNLGCHQHNSIPTHQHNALA